VVTEKEQDGIRSALLGEKDSEALFNRAKEAGYLKEVTT
jgi:hypothetical protein